MCPLYVECLTNSYDTCSRQYNEASKKQKRPRKRGAIMNDIDNKIARIEDLEFIIDQYGSCYAYEFDIKLPNGRTAGKVGDTNAPLRRRMEWAKVYKDWFEVKFSYLGTTDVDKDTFFRDFSIHAYGKQHLGWKQVPREDFPADQHYTQEAYYGATAESVNYAVKQVREGSREGMGTYKLYNKGKKDNNADAPTESFVPRANQQVFIDNFINAYFHGRHHLLCAAHPRFGKSFAALYAIDKLGTINFVMVVSAIADAHDEWKDTVNLPNFRNNWVFLDSKMLANGTGHDITDSIKSGKKVVVFCTLQDIEGDKQKAKHSEIYDFAKKDSSFLIVDETHNGARGITFSKKIKQVDVSEVDAREIEDINEANEAAVNFGFVNQLHLSGTPYRILLTDEFAPEDIVYMSSYSDLLSDKHAWDIEHIGKDERLNPYYEFPERYNFVYDLNQIPDERLKKFIDDEGLPRLSEVFAVNPDNGKFENEGVVRSIIKGFYGGFIDKGCWGMLADKVIIAAVKKFHILMKLPSIAACDAFAELIATCDEFKGYAIILATSNKHTNPDVKDIKAQVKAADNSDQTAGSITLTCQRLSAAVSVKQWNVAINATDGKSAQDYDQFAQRVCTPFSVEYVDCNGNIIKKVIKPNVFVVDLVPERMLSVAMQAAIAKCAARGVSDPESVRAELQKDTSNTMTFFVSGIKSMKQVTAIDIMDMAANYANASTIDTAVAKIPFCADLFNGATADVLNSLDSEISASKSFDTKVYDGADDADVSDKRTKPSNNENDENNGTSTDSHDTDAAANSKQQTNDLKEQEAKQRAFFARMGYLAVLADKQFDSLDAMLNGFAAANDGVKKVSNVTGLSLAGCLTIVSAIKQRPRVRIAADNLVYAMTRRINDENMTNEDRLNVLVKSFSKLGTSEVITPSNVTDTMIDKFGEDFLFDIIGKHSRIVELSAETGECAIALVKRFEKMGIFLDEVRRVVCSIPASPLAYELTKKVYELLGLDPDNIYPFSAYDLLDAVMSDSGAVDETAMKRVSAIMKQNKKPCDIKLDDVIEEGTDKVNIDAIVGNPPYQKDTNKSYKPPVYNEFMEFAFKTANVVILITPARFLFNAGGTPTVWNEKMLNDNHFKIIKYYAKSESIFPDVDIKGGIVITKHDTDNIFEPIKTFYAFHELKTIVEKISNVGYDRFNTLITNRGLYRFSKQVYSDHPDIMARFSDSRIAPSSFTKASELFFADKPNDGYDYIEIYGKNGNNRIYRWIRRDYVKDVSSLDKYKVFMPKANGSGALGETIATPLIGKPLIGKPLIGHTETFLTVGCFDTEYEANACLKYIKTKFARALLGILKVTQSNPSETWAYVPMQDFTTSSDIDWTQSVANIDKQLYKKYSLFDDEIDFIETHVQPMN